MELLLEGVFSKGAQNSWAWVWLLRTPLRILLVGPFWVLIFFTISGFVLPLRYFETGRAPNLLLRMIKRYLRLMLPLFGIISIYWVYVRLGLMYFDFYSVSQFDRVRVKDFSRLWYDGLVSTWLGNQDYNGATWTLKIELWLSFVVYIAAMVITWLRKCKRFLYATFFSVFYLLIVI